MQLQSTSLHMSGQLEHVHEGEKAANVNLKDNLRKPSISKGQWAQSAQFLKMHRGAWQRVEIADVKVGSPRSPRSPTSKTGDPTLMFQCERHERHL